MDEQRRKQRARTFDEIASLYDRARPYYREVLFEDLFRLTGLAPEATRILEVGSGTGRATEPLARRGCEVVCVEFGANLARIGAEKLAPFPGVTVVNADFEKWNDAAGRPFDIVLAATSWHWIDPRKRYQKAAALLRSGGFLAFTTGAHAFPPDVDPYFFAIQAAYRGVGMPWSGDWPPPPPEAIPDARAEVEASGLFRDARIARYLWAEVYDADSYVALMQTASDHRLLEPEKREWLFSEMHRLISARPGGRITHHQLTILHVARKTG